MIFEVVATTFFAIMTYFAFIFYRNSTQGQEMMVKTYKEVIGLLGAFRKELHESINLALQEHIKEYHQ